MPLASPNKVVYWEYICKLFSVMDHQLSFGVERDVLVEELQYYFKASQATDIVGEDVEGKSATKGTMQSGEIPVISGGRQPAFYCNQSNRTGETITVAGSGAGAGFVQYWNEPIFVCDAFSIKGNDGLMTKYIYYYLTRI